MKERQAVRTSSRKHKPPKRLTESEEEEESSSDSDVSVEIIERDEDKETKVLQLNKTIGLNSLKEYYRKSFQRHAVGKFANNTEWLIKKTVTQLQNMYKERKGKDLKWEHANSIEYLWKQIESMSNSKKRSHRNIEKEFQTDGLPTLKKKPRMKHTLMNNTPLSNISRKQNSVKLSEKYNLNKYMGALKNAWADAYNTIPMPADMNSPFINLVAKQLPQNIKVLRTGLDQDTYSTYV